MQPSHCLHVRISDPIDNTIRCIIHSEQDTYDLRKWTLPDHALVASLGAVGSMSGAITERRWSFLEALRFFLASEALFRPKKMKKSRRGGR